MKGKKKKNNSFEKLFAFVVFTIACVLGLIYAMNPNVFSSLVVNKNLKAAGDEPYRKKDIVDNHDGTYQLYLEVKGEANVVIVLDRSGSMQFPSENLSSTGRYGYNISSFGNSYVQLYREQGNRCVEVTNGNTSNPVYTNDRCTNEYNSNET